LLNSRSAPLAVCATGKSSTYSCFPSSEAKKNKKRPDGCKKEKDKQKKQAEASSIRDKMDDMLNSREHLVNKTLETKVMMTEKKSQEKKMRWELL
jgi:hypothetical protein